MNDNLPVLPALRTSQELVNPVTDSWAEMLPQVAELARAISNTDFVPAALRNNVAGTTAAILYNREIGLPPMTGLQAVHVIKGKVGISAEMMRAQILAAGHEIWFEETNTSYCIISGRRSGSDRVTTVKYSETDAKTAGLFSNDNYRKNPRRMYQARATSELAALIFADVIRGMVSSEELYAEVEAGESIAVPAEGGTTVQRKARARRPSPAALEAAAVVPLPGDSQTDDGAAAVAPPPHAAGGASSAPSSPLPPLPGEEDVPPAPAGEIATSTTEPTHGGSGSADASDPGSGEAVSDRRASGRSVEVPPGQGQPVEYMTDPQRGKLFALMGEVGLTEKAAQLEWISKNLGHVVTSRASLTLDDARILIDVLERQAPPQPVSRGDLRLLAGLFKELEIVDAAERLHIASTIIGRTPEKDGKPSAEGLFAHEAQTLLAALGRCRDRDAVEALVQMAEQEHAAAE